MARVTVSRPEGVLGTLIYRDGRHVEGVLNPLLIIEAKDP